MSGGPQYRPWLPGFTALYKIKLTEAHRAIPYIQHPFQSFRYFFHWQNKHYTGSFFKLASPRPMFYIIFAFLGGNIYKEHYFHGRYKATAKYH